MAKPSRQKTRAHRAAALRTKTPKSPRRRPPKPKRTVPPPKDELEPEPPPRAPDPTAVPPGLVTRYPDRSEYEAEVSERARQMIHEGKRPRRTRGPTTEAS